MSGGWRPKAVPNRSIRSLSCKAFAVRFLDNQHRLIHYAETIWRTIDNASVYTREIVKEALKINAATGNPQRLGIDQNVASATLHLLMLHSDLMIKRQLSPGSKDA